MLKKFSNKNFSPPQGFEGVGGISGSFYPPAMVKVKVFK
jgi:hypothetical protein